MVQNIAQAITIFDALIYSKWMWYNKPVTHLFNTRLLS